MKKRVSNSEIELARKSSKVLFLISFILLILLFICFGLLYLFDVDFSSYFEVPEPVSIVEKDDKGHSSRDIPAENIVLDVDDSNVLKYFEYVKVTKNNECENNSYYQDQVFVSKLSTKCKFSLASTMYQEDVKQALDGKLYVEEKDVKRAYETLYGNGTYVVQESIPCLYKTDFVHNEDYYFTQKVAEEAGSSMNSYEKVIEAVRNGDSLDITSAVLYY